MASADWMPSCNETICPSVRSVRPPLSHRLRSRKGPDHRPGRSARARRRARPAGQACKAVSYGSVRKGPPSDRDPSEGARQGQAREAVGQDREPSGDDNHQEEDENGFGPLGEAHGEVDRFRASSLAREATFFRNSREREESRAVEVERKQKNNGGNGICFGGPQGERQRDRAVERKIEHDVDETAPVCASRCTRRGTVEPGGPRAPVPIRPIRLTAIRARLTTVVVTSRPSATRKPVLNRCGTARVSSAGAQHKCECRPRSSEPPGLFCRRFVGVPGSACPIGLYVSRSSMYKAVTRGISVTVTPRFVPEESSPDDGRYFFAYAVEIINLGLERVQLRSRYWKIVDGRGRLEEVRGAGVIGKQPVLDPGESFSYTSGW